MRRAPRQAVSCPDGRDCESNAASPTTWPAPTSHHNQRRFLLVCPQLTSPSPNPHTCNRVPACRQPSPLQLRWWYCPTRTFHRLPAFRLESCTRKREVPGLECCRGASSLSG